MAKDKKMVWKRIGMWLCSAATTYFFFKIGSDIMEDGTSETKLLIGMIYFGWLAVMLKDG